MAENMDEKVSTLSPPTRNKKGQTVHRRERLIIVNLYKNLKAEKPGITKREAHTVLSEKTGFGIFTIKNTLLQYESTGTVTSPNNKKKRISANQLVDESDRNAIRRKFREFFMNNELPTLQTFLQAVNDDEDLPNFKRTTFWRLLKELKLVTSKNYSKKQLSALKRNTGPNLSGTSYKQKIISRKTTKLPAQ